MSGKGPEVLTIEVCSACGAMAGQSAHGHSDDRSWKWRRVVYVPMSDDMSEREWVAQRAAEMVAADPGLSLSDAEEAAVAEWDRSRISDVTSGRGFVPGSRYGRHAAGCRWPTTNCTCGKFADIGDVTSDLPTTAEAWRLTAAAFGRERDEARAKVELLRETLTEIASYHEHGKFSAITPAVLARKAQRALDAADMTAEEDR